MSKFYKSIGTIDAGIFGGKFGGNGFVRSAPIRMNDKAIANGGAFLASELEKLDPKISEPLTSITYPRDIRVRVGGGWVETLSKISVDYAVPGGSGEGSVTAPGANSDNIVQMRTSKDIFRTHVYSSTLRIPYIDMQRNQITGRSLEQILTDVIRLNYDKHMETNVYIGLPSYGTTGLLNNPNIVASPVSTGASGSTLWKNKTPDEILADLNSAISAGWEASGYAPSAIPNHVLIPYEQYTLLQTTKVSPIAEKTIMTFLLENNVAALNGGELVIGGTAFCKGAGAGGVDRMAAYVNNDRFVAVEELVSLTRTMTAPNTDKKSYDSIYMANISEVEFFYEQPVTYWDGI